jgi:hypothetical protein
MSIGLRRLGLGVIGIVRARLAPLLPRFARESAVHHAVVDCRRPRLVPDTCLSEHLHSLPVVLSTRPARPPGACQQLNNCVCMMVRDRGNYRRGVRLCVSLAVSECGNFPVRSGRRERAGEKIEKSSAQGETPFRGVMHIRVQAYYFIEACSAGF